MSVGLLMVLILVRLLGVMAGIFLLCLLFGWLIALVRFWQTPGFRYLAEFWLRRFLAVLRRVPPVGILLFSQMIRGIKGSGGGYPFSRSMQLLVLFLLAACFLPEVSDALLAGMRKVCGTQSRSAFLRRTLALAMPDLLGTLGELWKVSYIYAYLYPNWLGSLIRVYPLHKMYELKSLLLVSAVYWLVSLLADALLTRVRSWLAAGDEELLV